MFYKIGEKLFNNIKKVGMKVLNDTDNYIGQKAKSVSRFFENKHDKRIKKEDLNEDERQNINFSKESYKPRNERQNIGDFKYDDKNSNDETLIYKNDNNKAKVIHRGSKTLEDWAVSNVGIGMGMLELTPRYRRTNDLINSSKLENFEVQHIGHSLGGGLSKAFSKNRNEQGYGINPAVGYFSSFRENLNRLSCNQAPHQEHCKNYKSLRTSNDLVSSMATGTGNDNKIVNLPNLGGISSHSLSNF